MNPTITYPAALAPGSQQVDSVTQVLEESLGTKIDVTETHRSEKGKEGCVVYWWRTASADVVRGKVAFQYVQLQLVFRPFTGKAQIDFLCLPEGQKRQGKGRRVLKTILDVCRQLGYTRISIEVIEGSFPFWLKMGFKQLDSSRTSFPQPMFYDL
jgi:predicted N-acetyltransferase YhbS